MYSADINPSGNNFSVVLDTGRHALFYLTPFSFPPTEHLSHNISHLFLMYMKSSSMQNPNRWPGASSSAYYPAPPASPQNQNKALRSDDHTRIHRPIVQAFTPRFHRPVPIRDVPLSGGDDHPFHPRWLTNERNSAMPSSYFQYK
jgi:hypothetical protein